ncbi:phthiocerol/phthiodiolone dimycocerosyl transferase family protein [Jiulongibacter sediminis]|uniref:Phthiocerol/phthiodiolone dimycocerosyl transferase n=1 Tax=Jiulongibacter sediminis TaxID=1605367 RepID=A0A0P7BI27_9BACT|nr:condensation domain-containing protein [Jiulongibacter sediminis]KPM46715.1 hypothetical protein AFM12_18235 [Jiulongibacter sediminis]TBX21620.1 hypothetical protein TK44_18240 [Jiulongibacter sediminis]
MSYRKLNDVEAALTDSNAAFPMSTVIVVSLEGSLRSSDVRHAMDRLQKRHTLLRAHISRQKKGYYFSPTEEPLDLSIHPRASADSWKKYVEEAVNRRYDTNRPLLYVLFLEDPKGENHTELILVFHHAIIDGISARQLLTDMLSLLGEEILEEHSTVSSGSYDYPEAYQGWPGRWKKLSFLARQMKDEVLYAFRGDTPAPLQNSENRICSLTLNTHETRQLLVTAGRQKLSFNNVLSAAMLSAYIKQKNRSRKQLFRSISFADIRHWMQPPVPDDVLGCYFSMTRFTLALPSASGTKEIARDLWKQMYQSGKTGDIVLFAQMSQTMIQLMLKTRKFRMASTALSYIGQLDLKTTYGHLKPLEVRTFISNNQIGPPVSAFGRLLYGRLRLDFTLLKNEFTEQESEQLMKSIRDSLLSFSK